MPTDSYSTPGTYYWPIPAGITSVDYVVVAAGGGGGSSATAGSSAGSPGQVNSGTATVYPYSITTTSGDLSIVTSAELYVFVGTGGHGGLTQPSNGVKGGNSVLGDVTSTGGAYGVANAGYSAGTIPTYPSGWGLTTQGKGGDGSLAGGYGSSGNNGIVLIEYTSVDLTTTEITKELKYVVGTTTLTPLPLTYVVKSYTQITDELKYIVKKPVTISLELTYSKKEYGTTLIAFPLRYMIAAPFHPSRETNRFNRAGFFISFNRLMRVSATILHTLKYVVKTTGQTTKQLKYVLKSVPKADKELKYVVKKPTAIELELMYIVPSTPTVYGRNRFNRTKFNQTCFNRLDVIYRQYTVIYPLRYMVKTVPAKKEYELKYCVKTDTTKSFELSYYVRVKTATSKQITKELKYQIKYLSLRKSQTFELAYTVKVSSDIIIPLKYTVKSFTKLSYELSYMVISIHPLEYELRYMIPGPATTMELELQYVIVGEIPPEAACIYLNCTLDHPKTTSMTCELIDKTVDLLCELPKPKTISLTCRFICQS